MDINKEKLTYLGSMNYVVQIWTDDEKEDNYFVYNYQPRQYEN